MRKLRPNSRAAFHVFVRSRPLELRLAPVRSVSGNYYGMRFGLLGPLGGAGSSFTASADYAKQKTILALLLLHRDGDRLGRRLLKDALWGDSPPTTAATALQGYVSQLRRMLESGVEGGAALLVTSAPGYSLTAASEQVDFAQFEQLTESGRQALATGESGWSRRVALGSTWSLARTAAGRTSSYEGWAQAPIARFEELRLSALEGG